MFEKILRIISNLTSKKAENKKGIDNALLETVVNIAKRDTGNVLFIFSTHSYKDYVNSKGMLSNYIQNNMRGYKQRLSGRDATSSTTFKDIKSNLDDVAKEAEFDRLITSIFTRNETERDDLASKCLALDNVTVYVF
ncbi:hypothetical protein [Psychrobacter sp. R86515]|jgi:hypothetical protein|uniref:hypothetical protein n=1 Tax=Psychrobacter sp. R86515 TaxID=3093855 RepID=UPI0036D41687|tara:strand:- start:1153 stop:1563 length:411 start_codon:yes stop_codon:yes gene_type:complete